VTDFAAQHHEQVEIEVELLLEAIYRNYHYDFRHYSRSSVRRRLALALQKFGLDSLTDLQKKVLHDRGFFPQLLQYLTVPTTEFFRDPTYYLALRNHVIPVLRTYPSLKVWVAGCSTGEELYSLAIVFHEEGLLQKTVFYATDINTRSLETAKRGIYPIAAVADGAPRHRASGSRASLSDYYATDHDSVRFDGALSKNAVFADHSLATDEVFAEVHLVSCRNVLIYFDRSLQNRAVALFRRALVRQGFLGLGPKETLQFLSHRDAFEIVADQERIYRKVRE
jgi:chemotaxis protein methyltransferase CheR